MVTQSEAVASPHMIPFRRELPLIRSLLELLKDRLGLFLGMAQRYGDVCGFHFGPMRIIQFNSPHASFTLVPGQTLAVELGKTLTL